MRCWGTLHDQQRAIAYACQFDAGHEARRNAVGNQVADPRLFVQRVGNTQRLARIIHPDDQAAACRIREGDERLEHVARRRKVALELERLTFGLLQEVVDWVGHEGAGGCRKGAGDCNQALVPNWWF